MFIIDIEWRCESIPNYLVSFQDTFSEALGAIDRILSEHIEKKARTIDIFEADNAVTDNKKLIASLRVIR